MIAVSLRVSANVTVEGREAPERPSMAFIRAIIRDRGLDQDRRNLGDSWSMEIRTAIHGVCFCDHP
ncbi:MAG: hypothetical protein ACREPZ_11815 [Rhodanobacteraceae bacterium]